MSDSTTVDDRLRLILNGIDDVMGEDRLRAHLEAGRQIRHYIGLEISGQIHLGTGLMCMGKVADFQRAGVDCTVFLADWHSWINEKLGGDRQTIRRMARGYFERGLRASLVCCGGDPDKVTWQLGSDLYSKNDAYWETLIDVARSTTLARMKRSITILGRKEGGSVDFAKLLYPAMQVADVFAMGIHLAHAGTDQRKAHAVALDVAEGLTLHPLRDEQTGAVIKPVAVHHPLIMGLGKPPKALLEGGLEENRQETLEKAKEEMKMSKSRPDTAVFVHDAPDEIRRKMKKAYCLAGDVELNPVLDWAKQLLFRRDDFALHIPRKPEHGGDLTFDSYADLEAAFAQGMDTLHPGDLKSAVAEALIDILAPAREAFASDEGAAMLAEMRDVVEQAEQQKKKH